jgi:hypothetical protein
MVGLLTIIIETVGIILLLDIVALEMAYKAERDRLAKMSQVERMEYMLQKYGRDAPNKLAEHKF